MNRLLTVAILAICTLPSYAQSQPPNAAELAQTVFGIRTGLTGRSPSFWTGHRMLETCQPTKVARFCLSRSSAVFGSAGN